MRGDFEGAAMIKFTNSKLPMFVVVLMGSNFKEKFCLIV